MNGRLLAWYRDNNIELLDSASGQTLAKLPFSDPGHLSISPDSKVLAATYYANPIHLWDISAISKLAEADIPMTATPLPNLISTTTATATVSAISIQPHTTPTPGLNSIRPENITRLEILSEHGLGRLYTALWAPDGKSLALGGSPNV
ncbi:MAG: WD40 repeat domain-containing protein [Anaerolineales bacterium]